MFFCARQSKKNADVDFPRTLGPAVWLWSKCLSWQFVMYFCDCDECYWEKKKKARGGSLSKCFLKAVFYLWLSLNWNKCPGRLWYELLFQSVIGINLLFLIFLQMTACQVTLFHWKATISLSVKGCISCSVQYWGDWCLAHLSTEMTSQVKPVLWKSAVVSGTGEEMGILMNRYVFAFESMSQWMQSDLKDPRA